MNILASTREVRAQLLRPLPLFRSLSDTDLRRLSELATLRHCTAGEVLFRQGTPAEAFYVVLDGTIKIVRSSQDGREQTLHVFGLGQLVGEVPVFRNNDYPATGVCEQDARVMHISRAGILDILRETPDVALAFLAGVCERLRIFVDLVDGLTLKDGTARLAGCLLRLRREQGSDALTLACTKSSLATQLGMVPETLSRRLGTLQSGTFIRVQGRKITLLNPEGLRALAEG